MIQKNNLVSIFIPFQVLFLDSPQIRTYAFLFFILTVPSSASTSQFLHLLYFTWSNLISLCSITIINFFMLCLQVDFKIESQWITFTIPPPKQCTLKSQEICAIVNISFSLLTIPSSNRILFFYAFINPHYIGKLGIIIYNLDPMDLFMLLYLNYFINNLQKKKMDCEIFHLNFNYIPRFEGTHTRLKLAMSLRCN